MRVLHFHGVEEGGDDHRKKLLLPSWCSTTISMLVYCDSDGSGIGGYYVVPLSYNWELRPQSLVFQGWLSSRLYRL
jgi:hypothetical protein